MIPSIFLCHGGPTLVVEQNDYTNFLKDLGKKLKPKAIVIFTAHWESETMKISAINHSYSMIYDFSGFSGELYKLQYPAKGSVDVAQKLQALLMEKGIESLLDKSRGLDHGAWDVLYLMFPNGDVPVIQVSVNPELAMEKQYEIGRSIRSLGEEEILVIGSGATVHNLSTIEWNSDTVKSWAAEFDDWLIEKINTVDQEALYHYRELAPHAIRAITSEEHLVPLFIAMGSGNGVKPKLLHRSYAYGTLSYIAYEF